MGFAQKSVLWKVVIWEAWGLFSSLYLLTFPLLFFFLQLPQKGRIEEKSFFPLVDGKDKGRPCKLEVVSMRGVSSEKCLPSSGMNSCEKQGQRVTFK